MSKPRDAHAEEFIARVKELEQEYGCFFGVNIDQNADVYISVSNNYNGTMTSFLTPDEEGDEDD